MCRRPSRSRGKAVRPTGGHGELLLRAAVFCRRPDVLGHVTAIDRLARKPDRPELWVQRVATKTKRGKPPAVHRLRFGGPSADGATRRTPEAEAGAMAKDGRRKSSPRSSAKRSPDKPASPRPPKRTRADAASDQRTAERNLLREYLKVVIDRPDRPDRLPRYLYGLRPSELFVSPDVYERQVKANSYFSASGRGPWRTGPESQTPTLPQSEAEAEPSNAARAWDEVCGPLRWSLGNAIIRLPSRTSALTCRFAR
jgi:hypothetical protein